MRLSKSNFLEILKQHERILFKVSNAYCKDHEDRKDIVQEIILQMWNAKERYNPKYKFSTWIYRIALNTAISHYRKETKRKNSAIGINEELIQIAEDSDELYASDNNLDLLQKFISELDKLNKALILLYLENYSYTEIAEMVGITETNVATKISRVKRKLKLRFETQISD